MSRAYPESLLRFVSRFDGGEYWLAHEDLEELWLDDRKDLYKGLIQAAAALLHAQRGNWRGAASKARHATGNLTRSESSVFEIEPILARLGTLIAEADSLAAVEAGIDDDAFARVRFDLAPWFAGADSVPPLEREELPYRVRRYDRGYRVGRDPRRRD